ncbi:MAG: adenosylcobalamin-dependent ribonucleoside-diphosphate reductase [Acidimicrobiia bacterium]
MSSISSPAPTHTSGSTKTTASNISGEPTPPNPASFSNTKSVPGGRKGLEMWRLYTTDTGSPYDGLVFEKRLAKIQDFKTGETKFELEVEVPTEWDQGAVDVLASKYCRKTGVPVLDNTGTPVIGDDGNIVTGPETSVKQVVERLANAWMLWGKNNNYFASDTDAEIYRDEMVYMLVRQIGAPNSPQFFNTGLFEAYGIVEDSEGNQFFNPETGVTELSAHKYARSAASACYIQGVADNLVGDGGIMEFITNEARLFKGGSGSGSNLSQIREKGSPLTGGGFSSGVMSFARAADRSAGAIKSGGTTRRAAKMVILDADHPDILEFVNSKVVEEKTAQTLIAAGYDSHYDTPGGAYDIVSFQNANHSVRIPRGFLDKVKNNEKLGLVSRRDGSIVDQIDASELWETIAQAAWFAADPGIQFDGIINDWATTPNDGPIRGSNPCSEYLHIDDTACNLASLNLAKFFVGDTFENQTFNVEQFMHAVRLWTVTLEITVAMSHYPTALVAKNSWEHRTLGLGFANLGALIMRAGWSYDSPEARSIMGAVTSLMTSTAYATSAALAAVVGPCDAYPRNKEAMLKVLRNHRRAAHGSELNIEVSGDYEGLEVIPQSIDHNLLKTTQFGNLSEQVIHTSNMMVDLVETHGARNMQVTVIAPTGTIGLLMGCDTTGPEPDFALVKWKALAGGGTMKIVNQSVPVALRSLGYDENTVERIVTYALGTQTLVSSTPINQGSLAGAGVSLEELQQIEAAIPTSVDLAAAFVPHVTGDELYLRNGLDPNVTHPTVLLQKLGFTPQDIVVSSQTICGRETVEGAPDLKTSDLGVFDTANQCGTGTRHIPWRGHVEALGAIQPHVSGGISKTINLPNHATPEDILEAHNLAYEKGVKCVAVYRDGSKGSQPLTSSATNDSETENETHLETNQVETPHQNTNPAKIVDSDVETKPGVSPTAFYNGKVPPRFRLPKNRAARTFSFEIGNMDCYLTTGEYDDGTLGEIWLSVAKDGSTMRGAFSAFSIAISLGLQRGVPLEHFVDKFTGHNFAPNGIVIHPNLKMASSIPDAIFRLLGWWYLDRDDLVQLPERENLPIPAATTPNPTSPLADNQPDGTVVAVVDLGQTSSPYTGSLCPNCSSSHMVKNGTCERCLACGEVTGCS